MKTILAYVPFALSLVACSALGEAPPISDATTSGGTQASGSQPGAVTSSGGSDASDSGSATGGANTATGATGGGSGGIVEELPDPCAEGEWTCVRVAPQGPYGELTLNVPAQQNWVNTGLYLRAGQTATLTLGAGSWSFGNDDGDTIDHGPCMVADMVARIGLHYKDPTLTCVDGTVEFVADKDGILFVGALSGNDLGETYENRHFGSGEKTITILSEHDTVPTVLGSDAVHYDFTSVTSGWVEVWGEHVILTLPTSTAQADRAVLETATKTLDQIYEYEQELRGAVPHQGQRLRFFPDGTNPGYMLAGNPIRMEPSLVTDEGDRISRAGQPGVGLWGFAHEMGHDFSFVGRMWAYQDNTLESWCNLFSIYSLEKMGIELHGATSSCTTESSDDYDSWDAWGGLCFLRQFQFKYGWEFYKSFFTELNQHEYNQGIDDWNSVHDTFEKIAEEDVTTLFNAWNVPHPG